MSLPIPPHPEWSPKKHGPKRYFKGLVMPPVAHTPGAVPEEFQPKPDTRNARTVLVFLATAIVILSAWAGFVSVRKYRRARMAGASVCCGCEKRHEPGSCSKEKSCATSPSGSGCRKAGTPSGTQAAPASQPVHPSKEKAP